MSVDGAISRLEPVNEGPSRLQVSLICLSIPKALDGMVS